LLLPGMEWRWNDGAPKLILVAPIVGRENAFGSVREKEMPHSGRSRALEIRGSREGLEEWHLWLSERRGQRSVRQGHGRRAIWLRPPADTRAAGN
jgi:hypothetical protein